MKFDTLKDKCLYYRSLTDTRLVPNSYVLVMLDGRSFSSMIKNKFKLPFDDNFIDMMNETAKYVCENVSGCKLAYVQSDEISLVLTDFDTPTTDSFFGYRTFKLLSIIASLATAKFNQLMTLYNMSNGLGMNPGDCIMKTKLAQFDCKVWNVPTLNDVYAWFLYRQNDCIKNSKGQLAQTYYSHKELFKLTTDQQIEKLNVEKSINWHEFDDNKKYGRLITKQTITTENGVVCERLKWVINDAFVLNENREKFISCIPNNI